MTGEPKTVQERKPRIPDNNSFTNISFPGGSAGKESTCNVGDLGSVPGLGRFPGEGKGYYYVVRIGKRSPKWRWLKDKEGKSP